MYELLYKQAQRVTSTAELVGALKKPCFEAGRMHFTEAGELGFVAGPPETKKFYANFQYIESHASPAWNLASKELARLGVLDLTAVTVDGTNVPVDRRDTTGSVGTGSRGTFSGHKASVGASANCLPVSGVVAGGGRRTCPCWKTPSPQWKTSRGRWAKTPSWTSLTGDIHSRTWLTGWRRVGQCLSWTLTREIQNSCRT